MIIGIDLLPLQSLLKFQGPGLLTTNFINNLEPQDKKAHHFVFFLEKEGEADALSLLNLEGFSYELRYKNPLDYPLLPGSFHLVSKVLYKMRGMLQYMTGDPAINSSHLKGIDRFIQFDQNHKLPRRARKNTALFLHNLIPYILEAEYLKSYSTVRREGGDLKDGIKALLRRSQYFYKISINVKRARFLIANSEQTKKDFVKLLHISPRRISVVYPGVTLSRDNDESIKPTFIDYRMSMWGTVKRPVVLTPQQFLFYVGSADPRRKLVDLVAAFNNLRARGIEVSLAIAGEDLNGVDGSINTALRTYIQDNPSFAKYIHFLGFVSDEQKSWLYENALTFVFPSIYESFGLPVIEAMAHGTPIVAYRNAALAEVAGTRVVYADDFLGIVHHVEKLLEGTHTSSKPARANKAYASGFTWTKTKDKILSIIQSK
jgi:glycosyltransferase involved in cell wall biosynthesis